MENVLTKKSTPNWLFFTIVILVGIATYQWSTHQSEVPVKKEIKDIKAKIVKETGKASRLSKASVKQAEKLVKQLDTKAPPVYSAEREEIKRYLKTYNPSRAIEADTTDI